MRVIELLCSDETELHMISGHNITFEEAEEAIFVRSFVVRGREKGVYEYLGRTNEGRYLMVAVRSFGKGVARVITSREMTDAERRRYNAHIAH
ncbi:MAG: BrnT family toxin [Elusimicrobia bacterium]|nr:BrnT family toxin [Elusimicrobiota bacterium]